MKNIGKLFSDIYIDIVLYAIFLTYIFIGFNLTVVNLVVMILTLVALVLWIVSRVQLGSSFSVLPTAKRLVTNGIYSKIRNPIYLFTGLANIGIIYLLGNPYLFIIVPIFIAIQIIRAKREEKILVKTFGDEYLEYWKGTWF
ncbi:MAG: isoprenylcysteine carboxylmethyltransferase family protein [Candidatus Saccharibacteria bacterium]